MAVQFLLSKQITYRVLIVNRFLCTNCSSLSLLFCFQNVFVHCGSNDPVELSNFFSVLGKCFDQKSEGGLLETYLEFDVITAVTQIKVVPINSVPIMLTALSKDLASPMGWSNLHGQSRSG